MFGEPCAELMDNNNYQSKVEKTVVGAEQMVLFCLCVFFPSLGESNSTIPASDWRYWRLLADPGGIRCLQIKPSSYSFLLISFCCKTGAGLHKTGATQVACFLSGSFAL